MNEIRIDVSKLKEVVCGAGCASKIFVPVFELRVLPALLSPTRKQEFVTIQRWQCAECGELVQMVQVNN